MYKYLFVLVCAMASLQWTHAAVVDTIAIPSTQMRKTYKAVVVMPQTYAKKKQAYPVMYLLHGGFGHYNDWITKTPNKSLIQDLADQYNLLIVMPEGEVFSYYLDSPVVPESQFESYIIKDVVAKIDNSYRTIRDRNGRFITGLSMGGYGALYLATRHPDLFGTAGSMSGALNPDMQSWRLPEEPTKNVKTAFAGILGPLESNVQRYYEASVVNMADKMKTNQVRLVFDCGVDDFLIEPNRELHRRLVYNQTPHDYSERPGGHSWEYWQNSLPYHVLYFHTILKENKLLIN